jgi:hypothetical protein
MTEDTGRFLAVAGEFPYAAPVRNSAGAATAPRVTLHP